VAEWPKATDCKSVKSLVQIQPSPPEHSRSAEKQVGIQSGRQARIQAQKTPWKTGFPQTWSRSLAVRISPCHGDGMGSIPVETAKFWRRSINGDALDCKSGALGTTGSIPVFSTKYRLPSSRGLGHRPFTASTPVRIRSGAPHVRDS
jgi:hypothetical protein